VHVRGGRAPVPVAPHPTNPDEFQYNGRSWALGDTTSNEIERATAGEPHPVIYYHNALANPADALARMRAVERHVDWSDNLTHRPEWQMYATRSAEQARLRSRGLPPRQRWEQPKLPQLRDGGAVPRLVYGPSPARRFRRFPPACCRRLGAGSMFWNPVPHMQRVLEFERKGMATREAIREAEKHIPNYRIPTEVMNTRWFSQLLQQPAFTVFSRYHYGMFRSYANMLSDLIRGTGREKLEAIGNTLALGLFTWVVYPALDQAVRSVTGNEEDQKIRRGPATTPNVAQHRWEGDDQFLKLLSDAIARAVPVKLAGGLLGGGRDPCTGESIMQPASTAPDQAGQGASWLAGQLVQPWQLIGRKTPEEGGRTFKRAVTDQILGLRDSWDGRGTWPLAGCKGAEVGRPEAPGASPRAARGIH
jgi:hypothetical protein